MSGIQDTAEESQKKDFEYVTRLAQQMKRAASRSYTEDTTSDDEPVDFSAFYNTVNIDDLNDLIPTQVGEVNDDNDVGPILQSMKNASTGVHTIETPYNRALRFGESYLGLEDDTTTPVPSLQSKWALTPTQVVNGIENAIRENPSLRSNLRIATSNKNTIVDVVVHDDTIILVLDDES